jgi:hypothetical protein
MLVYHPRLSQERELKAHALGLLRERIAGSESAQLAAGVAALEADLDAARAAMAAAKKRKADAAASAKARRLICIHRFLLSHACEPHMQVVRSEACGGTGRTCHPLLCR